MKKDAKKEQKPIPKRCVCGSKAITVKVRGKKMVSCPDPMNCRANLRTTWKSAEEAAIVEWNGIVDSFYSECRNKGGNDNENHVG